MAQAPGIAKRQGVHRETVAEMRAKGLTDEMIEAKLAAGRPKREALKAKKAAEAGTPIETPAAVPPLPPSSDLGRSNLQNMMEEAEIAKARRIIRREREEAGGLVDAGAASKANQARAAKERDALMALPARIVGPMAAKLGVPEPLLLAELNKAIRVFLTERSQPNANTAAA